MNQRPFRANERILHLLLVSAKLLREGDGHGALQMRAPIFTTPPHAITLACNASCNVLNAGINRSCTSCAVAMLIAVGNVSLLDCDLFT